jgi:hypothetical protein
MPNIYKPVFEEDERPLPPPDSTCWINCPLTGTL